MIVINNKKFRFVKSNPIVAAKSLKMGNILMIQQNLVYANITFVTL